MKSLPTTYKLFSEIDTTNTFQYYAPKFKNIEWVEYELDLLVFNVKYRDRDFFGERALEQLEPWAATIYCSTPCEFIILSKDVFDQIKKKVEESRIHKICDQLDKFQLFSSLSRKLKERLCQSISVLNFDKGKRAYRENDTLNKFYFVVKGSFVLSKNYLPHGTVISSFKIQFLPMQNCDVILKQDQHDAILREVQLTHDYSDFAANPELETKFMDLVNSKSQ